MSSSLNKLTIFFAALLTLALVSAPTISSADPVGDLEDRVHKLESQLHTSQAEKHMPGLMREVIERLSIGGLVEVEGFVLEDDDAMDGDNSDIVLATVELAIGAEIHEFVSAHILLLWEEDSGEGVIVDEGIITITMPIPGEIFGAAFSAGKMYIPFGAFHSHMITSPMTKEVGETNETAAMMTLTLGPVELSVGGFNGDVDEDDDRIQSYFGNITVHPVEYVTFGGYYLSNIADTDGLSHLLEHHGSVVETVDGAGGFISLTTGHLLPVVFIADAEWVGALDNFEITDMEHGGSANGDKPSAYSLEIAIKPHERVTLAGMYEANRDLFDIPEIQYGATVSFALFKHTTLAFEYLEGEHHEDGLDNKKQGTAQLAVEF